jgi:hypothetical protein
MKWGGVDLGERRCKSDPSEGAAGLDIVTLMNEMRYGAYGIVAIELNLAINEIAHPVFCLRSDARMNGETLE